MGAELWGKMGTINYNFWGKQTTIYLIFYLIILYSELSTCKSSNSFKKCETGMDYKFDMNTTPDVVKLHGLKRAATIKSEEF